MTSEIIILSSLTFFTSAFTAIVGAGGGLVLLTLLPQWLAPAVIIPVHGVVQLFSNLSRAYFMKNSIDRSVIPLFIVGCTTGAIAGGLILKQISLEYIPLIMGIYVLLNLWCKPAMKLFSQVESLFLLGAIQGSIGLFIGAPGPLIISAMKKKYSNHQQLVATTAIFTAFSHMTKLVIYILLGFAFINYLPLITFMIIAAIAGSYVGKKLQGKANIKYLSVVLSIILTFLAFRMIFTALNL
ncbi:sulfite exporter TauE/SafE family protein [Vibrio sp. SS-MA-C1-2]|uniref:sulfite exporter TauE/SafE family protein n=1 Tax=Vibrio sp. SS-MA-C1-2 TaxID=2908646 RepID=UPI001F28A3C6|nr:sulfite exporter TauE/SafE family protein [Vibrio sp. SS-MA-C1-2]UJF18185.1 sulfite exporter TauE/SafE family protein [Vibrio sp. SS-MA-C1-2]